MKELRICEMTPTIEKLLVEDNELQAEVDIETALSNMPAPTCCQVHILVVVPEKQFGSVEKQRRYKKLSTESSSRTMLDALAYNLALKYNFETIHCQATIDDVFHAGYQCLGLPVEYLQELQAVEELRASKRPNSVVPDLPNRFEPDEWGLTKEISERTSNHIRYVVLPHDLCGKEQVSRLKEIAQKASIGSSRGLHIIDEDEL